MPKQLSPEEIAAKSRQMIALHGDRAADIVSGLVIAAQQNDQLGAGDLVREMLNCPDLAATVVGKLTSTVVNLASELVTAREQVRGPAIAPERLGVSPEELERARLVPSTVAALDQVNAAFENGDVPQAAQMLVDGEIQALRRVYENHYKEVGSYPDIGTVMSVAVMWMRNTALLIASEALHRLILQEVWG